MNNDMRIISFTLIIYFLMDRFQVFNLVHRNMKGYDIRFIYGVKIALLILVLYVSIKNIPYFHGVEEITNQYADFVVEDVNITGDKVAFSIGSPGMDDLTTDDIKFRIDEYLTMNEQPFKLKNLKVV